jgi:WD40 repeat protein
MTTAAAPPNPRPNPYVGPRAFEPHEQLYGRDVETRKLANLLGAERIVLLHAPSGAGKTSLIQAALLPRMRERRFHVRAIVRVNREAARHPAGYNRYLFSVLSALESAWPQGEQIPEDELAGMTPADYLARRPRPAGANFELFVFDQFEEVLTLDPIDREAKREFFEQLGALLEDTTRWALFSMREDFLGALAPYVTPIPNRLSTTFRLDLLGEEAARQALQRPVRAAGVDFADDAAQALVDDLRRVQVQRPDGTLEQQLGPYVEPVQLQVVGYRLWESLAPDDIAIDRDDLAALGDVGRALADYYAGRVAAIAAQSGVRERAIREWFERRLITEQGIRGQVLMGAERSEGLDNRAVRLLENAHLVRGEQRGGATWYELAHDRLIEPVRRDNAAWFAAHLSLVQRQAELWAQQHQAESLLLRGQELVEGEAWADGHAGELTEIEQKFIEACRKARAAAEAEARVNRRVRRALTAAVITAAVAIVLALAAASMGYQVYQFSQSLQARSLAALSDVQRRSGNRDVAVMLAYRALQDYPYSVEAEQALGDALLPRQDLPSWPVRYGSVLSILAGPSGAQVMTVWNDGAIRAWDASTGQMLSETHGPSGILTWAVFNPDGTRFVALKLNNTVELWDTQRGELVSTLNGHTDQVTDMVFSADGTRLVTASDDGTARVWDGQTGQALFALTGHTARLTLARFSADGARIMTACSDGTVRLWDAGSGQLLLKIESGLYDPLTAAFSPDGTRLAAAGNGGMVWVWDPRNGKYLFGLEGHLQPILHIAFSLDGKHLITASADNTAQVWDAQLQPDPRPGPPPPPGQERWLFTLSGHNGFVRDAAFSADGTRLVTASDDGTARVWDARTGAALFTLAGHTDAVLSASFSTDGARIFTFGADGTARVWDAATGLAIAALPDPLQVPAHTGYLTSARVSVDGTRLVTAGADATLRVWDVDTGQATLVPGPRDGVATLAVLSPDKTRLVVAVHDIASLRMVDVRTGSVLFTLEGHTARVTSAAFNADGTRLVTAGLDGTAQIWDARTGKRLLAINAVVPALNDAEFSPDGTRIVTAGTQDQAWVWDAQTGDELLRLDGHTGNVLSAVFSPDGTRIVTASADETARVWDAQTGQELQVLKEHTAAVSRAVFNADGTRVATMSDDQTVRVWDVQHGQQLLLFAGTTPPLALAMIADDVVLLVSEDGSVQRWPTWPSRAALLEQAQALCGACQPAQAQRLQFRLYDWPMLAAQNWRSLALLWAGLLCAWCAWATYRALWGAAVPAAGSTSAQRVAAGPPGFTWRRFAGAGAQGGLLAALGAFGVFAGSAVETELLNDSTLFSTNAWLWFALALLPLGLWAGLVYGHFTRRQSGRLARLKRVVLGGLAGLAGGALFGLLALIVLSAILTTTIGSGPNLADAGDWLLLLVTSLIFGVTVGVLSAIGAALYVLVAWRIGERG